MSEGAPLLRDRSKRNHFIASSLPYTVVRFEVLWELQSKLFSPHHALVVSLGRL